MSPRGLSLVRVVRGRCRTATALLLSVWMVGSAAYAQQAAPSATKPVQVNRAARDAWSPIMDVLKASRTATVTDAQLQRLRELPLEAVWGALQNRKHVRSFEGGFQLTVPNPKLVGRAVTMRYLPVRPDLMDAVQTLAKEGDWDYQYNVRAGEDLKPGDVVVVELGGMVDRATFLGDVTGLGMKVAGAQGVIVDGGIRDLSEFMVMKDLPIFYRGAHASAMADQVGVEWNGPIRLGGITVLPGDIIVADAEGVLAVPPQMVQALFGPRLLLGLTGIASVDEHVRIDEYELSAHAERRVGDTRPC